MIMLIALWPLLTKMAFHNLATSRRLSTALKHFRLLYIHFRSCLLELSKTQNTALLGAAINLESLHQKWKYWNNNNENSIWKAQPTQQVTFLLTIPVTLALQDPLSAAHESGWDSRYMWARILWQWASQVLWFFWSDISRTKRQPCLSLPGFIQQWTAKKGKNYSKHDLVKVLGFGYMIYLYIWIL